LIINYFNRSSSYFFCFDRIFSIISSLVN